MPLREQKRAMPLEEQEWNLRGAGLRLPTRDGDRLDSASPPAVTSSRAWHPQGRSHPLTKLTHTVEERPGDMSPPRCGRVPSVNCPTYFTLSAR